MQYSPRYQDIKDLFSYNGNIDTSYNYEYNCDSHGCHEEGICRCGTIVDISINSVDISYIASSIYSIYFNNSLQSKREQKLNSILYKIDDDIQRYTIDRVLRINKVWDVNLWNIDSVGGYYGDEMGDANFSNLSKLSEDIEYALSIEGINDRINHLLHLEYGSLLTELVNCEYQVVDIDISQIDFGSKKHYEYVKSKDLKHYGDNEYDGIRGVVRKRGSRFSVIDGYHRLSSTNKKKVKVILAF